MSLMGPIGQMGQMGPIGPIGHPGRINRMGLMCKDRSVTPATVLWILRSAQNDKMVYQE